MWRKANPHALLVGLQIGAAPMQNSMENPQKIKNWTVSNFTSEYLSKENKNTNLKSYMHSSVHCDTVYSNQDMEAT